MSKGSDSLLNFNEFEDFGESPEISVNSPKKATINDGLEATPTTSAKISMFQIEYYQQFFNIDTMEVVDRIATSIIPKRAPSTYLKTHLGVNPDLYGPFWVTITLIFAIGISGNLANFLQHDHTSLFIWHYNFHLVSYASTCIIMYVCIMPIVIWGVLKWSVNLTDDIDLDIESAPYIPSLLSLVCLYGYSLAVYIPVSILWTIQFSFLQWLLVLTAAFLSGSVLINILMPSLKLSKYSFFLIIGIASAHFLLAAGFMLYFFHVPSATSNDIQKQPMVNLPIVNTTG
ncbi:CLUMA_CG017024, isoform A [Clunio marinus]|uniref:Protein YIPF n=1 Tax=Clunio marinus TaxID=568069 RepID=A0A1J1IXL2_9DIPT|nr:CLUMA_CG017024, isoform A [Clunio marinus]